MALKGINNVNGRFISKATKKWFIYRIAFEFNLNPREVETWQADEILETLAAIGLASKKKPK